MREPGRWGGTRSRLAIGGVATALVLGPLAWFWQASLLPGAYSVMDMGYLDYGRGPAGMAQDVAQDMAHHGDRSVTSLTTDRDRPADVSVTLVAREQRFRLASGRTVDGYTLNGRSPGPTIRVGEGQLVEVRLVNDSVPDGITLHWHGVDVPNGEDGVAGVTQDAVPVGEEFTYRFVAHQVGTFWYHSHQVSHEQVRRGLLGALVVMPAGIGGSTELATVGSADVTESARSVDVVALTHLYNGVRTVNGREGGLPIEAPAGRTARVRVINTDNGPMSVWVAGAPYTLVAVDGTDLNQPTPVRDTAVLVTAGGRADLEVTMPADGSSIRVQLGGSASVVLGSKPFDAPTVSRPRATLDLLSYGRPAALPFDPDQPDRRFEYDIGRRPGFLDGRPGMWWTINGHQFPDIPMYVVSEGDVVRMRLTNNSAEVHPMHLHGHHAAVLSRDGKRTTGSPWWVDSLNVAPGQSYEIAFVADNPGIWMDHCHNLPHATEGLVAHVMYEGVTTPFTVGGNAANEPE